MPIVKYTDNNKFMWAVVVEAGTKEKEYEQGAIIGPPDLTVLGLPAEKLRSLHNELVEKNLYNAPLLMGKRAVLKSILTGYGIDVKILINLFQLDYYGA